jgi:hypothetical protein
VAVKSASNKLPTAVTTAANCVTSKSHRDSTQSGSPGAHLKPPQKQLAGYFSWHTSEDVVWSPNPKAVYRRMEGARDEHQPWQQLRTKNAPRKECVPLCKPVGKSAYASQSAPWLTRLNSDDAWKGVNLGCLLH